ncbi:HNH endonuclease signature motif containing protein [Gordonia hongkongensis]|uniref:HNH endonuclease signature motif containing protein n=1 Tax=Gordonia hongkongensis TaxID=1701090 RepID=UPI001FF820A0|nr:HNH endonuclease signature motif containing protein [Gordonia hongkongensis]UPG68190.1 HNH endonuclease [Gordonia hongkongensis]
MTRTPKATAKAPTLVRYKDGNSSENRLLRLALLKAWGELCYLCSTPVTFVGAEIDHILPKTITDEDLDKAKHEWLEPARATAFDLNSAHNLAPICRKCNSDKSDTRFTGVRAIAMWLDEAHKKQASVERYVKGFRNASGVQGALVRLLEADFSSAAAKDCLLELGPALLDRLRAESPSVLEAPSTHEYRGKYSSYGWHELEPRTFADGPLVASVVLDEGSRRAKVVLEDVFGWDFDRSLDVALEATASAVRSDLADQIAGKVRAAGHDDPDLGSVEGFMQLAVVEVRFDADDRCILVKGHFDADGSAEVAIADYQNDSGTVWGQWDAGATSGSFAVSLLDATADDVAEVSSGDVVAVVGDVELTVSTD